MTLPRNTNTNNTHNTYITPPRSPLSDSNGTPEPTTRNAECEAESNALDNLVKHILTLTNAESLEKLVPADNSYGLGGDGKPRDPEVLREAVRLATDVPDEHYFRHFLLKAVSSFSVDTDHPSRAYAYHYDRARILYAQEEMAQRLRFNADAIRAKGHEEGHEEGHAEGHAEGYKEGHEKGYAEGSKDGEDRGRAEGYQSYMNNMYRWQAGSSGQ